MISKLKDQKIQKRLLIFALVLTTSFAIASSTGLLDRIFNTDLTHGPVMEMDLIQTAVTGEVVPGQALNIAPIIQNVGTKQCLAFVKVTVPTYGDDNEPAYSYTPTADWTKISEKDRVAVFGYKKTLENGDLTTAPMNGITLKNISVPEFLSIPDLNINIVGYLAETAEFGTDPQSAWDIIQTRGS